MDYGLYLAASGMYVNLHRQDVAANNLANVATNGFKPEYAVVSGRAPERVEAGLTGLPPKELLERLGGGVLLYPDQTDHTDGPLSRTDAPLDLAIRGEGFFVFTTGKGEGNTRLRFSRDGRFTLDREGYLVHASSGMRVLDSRDQAIRIPSPDPLTIKNNGEIEQNGATIAQLGFITVDDRSILRKAGANTFLLHHNAQESRLPAPGSIEQGWVEESAVNPMAALTALNSATGAVNTNAQMLRMHDQLLNLAISRLGRVA